MREIKLSKEEIDNKAAELMKKISKDANKVNGISDENIHELHKIWKELIKVNESNGNYHNNVEVDYNNC